MSFSWFLLLSIMMMLDVLLTRQSPNQSLGLYLSSDPPTESSSGGQDSNHQSQRWVNNSNGNQSPSSNQVNGGQEEQSTVNNGNGQSELRSVVNDDQGTRSEVYISYIEPGGLVQRCGSIKVGDQILEINGYEVTSLEEAKAILGSNEINSFELLIGRPNPAHDHNKCRERSLARRLSLFESSENGDANHVAIVDCSQEFYILSMDSNKANTFGLPLPNTLAPEQQGGTANRVAGSMSSGTTNGVYDNYGVIGRLDEKDSGVGGKTDGDSSCSRTNDTCSTDHELNGSSYKIQPNNPSPPLPQSTGLSGHGSASHSSGNSSLEGKRQIIQIGGGTGQFVNGQFQKVFLETSTGNKMQTLQPNGLGIGTNEYEECHYASTEIVPTPSSHGPVAIIPPQPPMVTNSVKGKPSPPEVLTKPIKKLPTPINGQDKSNDDLALPEMQPAEKKESIKMWIKSGLPTTLSAPPLTATITNTSINNGTNINMAHRPSSFKPGLVNMSQSPMDPTNNSKVQAKEDKAVATEEKGTQVESDAASLMSCDSCRMCYAKAHGTGNDHEFKMGCAGQQRLETFQIHPVALPSAGRPSEGRRSGNLPIPVKAPVVPDLSGLTGSTAHNTSDSSKMIKSTSRSQLREEGKENVYSTVCPTATMYTTKANLEHTIMLQQEMFRQALIQQQKIKPWSKRTRASVIETTSNQINRINQNRPTSSSQGTPLVQVDSPSASLTSPSKHFRHLGSGMVHSTSLSKFKETRPKDLNGRHKPNEQGDGKQTTSGNGTSVNMEWKVKKRPDGTRYITRKPIRSKILKERAEIINQERSGLTTDDEAMSELKVGRYWTRDERKKHSERAKDRKRREMLLRAIKMSSVREGPEEWDLGNNNPPHPGGGKGENGGGHSSSGSSGSMAKVKMALGIVKGLNLQKFNGNNNLITLPVDKGIQSLIKQSTSSPTGGIVKLIGPMNRAPSKNQINELLTVTTV